MSDIDAVVVGSLKALDPKRPIREADMPGSPSDVVEGPIREIAPLSEARYACDSCGCDNFSREQVWLLPARNREPRL